MSGKMHPGFGIPITKIMLTNWSESIGALNIPKEMEYTKYEARLKELKLLNLKKTRLSGFCCHLQLSEWKCSED